MSESFDWLEQDSDLTMDSIATSGWTEEKVVSTWDEAQADASTSISSVKRKARPLMARKSKKKKKEVKRKRREATPFFERPIVAMDTEYVESECGTFNRILSYQFAVLFRASYQR